MAHSDDVVVMNEGKIAMQGTPEEIFSDIDRITNMHLDVPFSLKLSKELKKNGVNVDNHILEEVLVEDLCKLKSKI